MFRYLLTTAALLGLVILANVYKPVPKFLKAGKRPFTVFAPTNEAFAKLDKRVLEYLLEPAHKDKLQKLLTYHVVAAEAKSTDLKNGELIKTVEGHRVRVSIEGSEVHI